MNVTGSWLTGSRVQALFNVIEGAGHQIYAVGGCVRDDLLGRPVADIDFATNTRPDTVSALIEEAGWAAIPTGIDHGTITAVIDHQPFEITTFRKDVATDGRRAVVEFADEIEEDARRRDFTINALYAGRDGEVFDPVGGLADIGARRVRFIGNATTRIAEDALRILRYFRFFASVSGADAAPDQEAMTAITASVSKIGGLSAERIGAETRKLLSVETIEPALRLMEQSGVLDAVVKDANVDGIDRLSAKDPDAWLVRFASLTADMAAARALRFSRKDMQALRQIWTAGESTDDWPVRGFRFGAQAAEAAYRIAQAQVGAVAEPTVLDGIHTGAAQEFPIRAADLLPLFPEGPEIGAALAQLKEKWIASRFQLDRATLLEMCGADR